MLLLGHGDGVLLAADGVLHSHALHDAEAGVAARKVVGRIDGQMTVAYLTAHLVGDVHKAEGQELSVVGMHDFEVGKQLRRWAFECLAGGSILHVALCWLAEHDEVGFLGLEGERNLRDAVGTAPHRNILHAARLRIPELGHQAFDAEAAELGAIVFLLVRHEIDLGLARRTMQEAEPLVAIAAAEVGQKSSLLHGILYADVPYLPVVILAPQLVDQSLILHVALRIAVQRR